MTTLIRWTAIIVPLIICSIILTTKGADLKADDPHIVEEPCQSVAPAPDLMNYFKLPILARPTVFFLYFASQSFHRSQAELLLGRPPSTEQEVDSMCPQMLLADLVSTVVGFRDKILINRAVPDASLNLNDTNAHAPPEKNPMDRGWANETISWANEDHVLMTRCVLGKRKDWVVASHKLPTPEIKKTILKVVKKLGFNPALARDASGKKCSKSLMSPQKVAAKGVRLFRLKQEGRAASLQKLEKPLPFVGKPYDTLGKYFEAVSKQKE